MASKRILLICTSIWLISISVLLWFLFILYGDAQVINYTGLVRGSTQRVVANELHGEHNAALISYVDEIIDDLQNGTKTVLTVEVNDPVFQEKLATVNSLWEKMKQEMDLIEEGNGNLDYLYSLSQNHFYLSNQLVCYVEDTSNQTMNRLLVVFIVTITTLGLLTIYLYRRNKTAVDNSQSKDWLTGILNRRGFSLAIEEHLRHCPEKEHVLIRFDMASFKLINNYRGSQAGDQLLCDIANALSHEDQFIGLCSRLYSDHFIFLTKYDKNLPNRLEKLLSDVLVDFGHHTAFGEVPFYYGAYHILDPQEDIGSMLDKSNLAHRFAKEARLNSFVWYDSQLLSTLEVTQQYINQMEPALQGKEFQLYLQPQVDLSDNSVTHAESLVRWLRPDGTLLFPDAFIPLFEHRGVIHKLDFYMLDMVCSFLSQLQAEGKPLFTIGINFSRVTLCIPDFYQQFMAIIQSYDLPHDCIEIEVTETSLHQLSQAVIDLLTRLRKEGFLLSMDDFGAGYSSLSFLTKFPVHTLKLDRQFLWEMDNSDKMRDVIECTISMAHKIGLEVVCEGVETQTHLDFIQQMGCNYAQGYFFAKPLPSQVFIQNYI